MNPISVTSIRSASSHGRGAIAFALGALLFASVASAQHVTATWDAADRFSHEASVAPGKALEVCEPLAIGARVGWSYEASAPLDFNVHIHVGSRVEQPERRDATAKAEGTLVVAATQPHCWMWINRGAAPVALTLRLARLAVTPVAVAPAAVAPSASIETRSVPCPKDVPADARCWNGRDDAGAPYWIAMPAAWNGVLVMHAHGGPETGAPTFERGAEDLTRWSVMVKAGYLWAGSVYRRGGYGVTLAAEDTERLRQLVVARFGAPKRTILHGQSYGGGVAAIGAERYGPKPGQPSPYDGVLLTSAVLGGGNNAYEFRLDLRVVWQYVCRNHPRPDEPQYPLWQGLPPGATMHRNELATRVTECTGVGLPSAQRSPEQARRLKTILSVLRIPERTLLANLQWATVLFQDLTERRLGGRNPFGNAGVFYAGSDDDAALNAGVPRYTADPAAQAVLAADSKPTGRIALPVLTMHAIDDPTAFVELESAYREIVEQAGASNWLVQTFTDEHDHSYLSDAEYPAAMTALLDWIERGEKPTPEKVARLCAGYEAGFGKGCHIRPEYRPAPLASRVPAAGR